MPLAAELMAVSAGVGTMAAGGLQYYSDDGSAGLLGDFDAEFGRNVVSVTIASYATMDYLGLEGDLASANIGGL